MLTLTTQERIDLFSAYGSMLTDECRKNRLNPSPKFYKLVQDVSGMIVGEAEAIIKAMDDARFQATWGDGGILAEAWKAIAINTVEEDAAMDELESHASHVTPVFNPKVME